jgi:hypothetical protein
MDGFTLLGALFFGFMATEGTVEYFLGTLFDKIAALTPHKWVLMYLSALVGVGFAWAYGFDLIASVFGYTSPGVPWLGVVLTGIVLGRGANFVNDIWGKYLKPRD